MKRQRMATMLILLCMLGLLDWPQDQGNGQQVVAKLQIFFSELETQWLKAAQGKDAAGLKPFYTNYATADRERSGTSLTACVEVATPNDNSDSIVPPRTELSLSKDRLPQPAQ